MCNSKELSMPDSSPSTSSTELDLDTSTENLAMVSFIGKATSTKLMSILNQLKSVGSLHLTDCNYETCAWIFIIYGLFERSGSSKTQSDLSNKPLMIKIHAQVPELDSVE